MDGVDGMGPRRMRVQLVGCVCSIYLSLEQLVQSVFFILANMHGHILNRYSTSHIILNWQLLGLDPNVLWRNQKVDHSLVIDLDVTDSDGDSLIKLAADLVVDLLNSSGNDSSVLIIIGLTKHRESFSSTGLTVAHHSSIVPSNGTIDNVWGSLVINIILCSVMQNGVEFELPVIKLVVHCTEIPLVTMDIEITCLNVDFEVVGCKLISGSSPDDNLNGLLWRRLC